MNWKANPTIAVSGTNATVTTSPSGSALPGTTVTVTLTPAENYYNATATATGATLKNAEVNTDSSTYSFVMPENDVTITGTAIEYPYIVFTSVSNCTVYKGSSKDNNAVLEQGTKLYCSPGDSVEFYIENTDTPSILVWSDDGKNYPEVVVSSGNATSQNTGTGTNYTNLLRRYSKYTVAVSASTGAINLTATGDTLSS